MEVFGEFVGEKVVHEKQSESAVTPAEPMLRPIAVDGLVITSNAEDIEFRSRWLRLVVSRKSPRITAICWDSLGAGKVVENLIKPTLENGVRVNSEPLFPESDQSFAERTPKPQLIEQEGNVVRYSQLPADGLQGRWEIRVEPKSFQIRATSTASKETLSRDPFGVNFAFDVGKTPVVPLSNPKPGVSVPLPCLLHAADYGSLLVRAPSGASGTRLFGAAISPMAQWNAFIGQPEKVRASDGLFIVPAGSTQMGLDFSVEEPLPLPELIRQEPRLHNLPRSWLNTFQYRPDIGILSNNIVSDNAIFCMFTFTDPAVFTPVLPGEVETIQLTPSRSTDTSKERMDTALARKIY